MKERIVKLFKEPSFFASLDGVLSGAAVRQSNSGAMRFGSLSH